MGKNRQNRGNRRRQHGTPLGKHRNVGKTLVPPLNTLPGVAKHTRWLDERMPEMLWACLVRAVLPRDQALAVFRDVAVMARGYVGVSAQLHELIPTHSNLAQRHPELIPKIVQLIATKPLGYAALRPMLLLAPLPGRDHWVTAIAADVDPSEINVLADAVAEYFDHQSEHSTDVRWLYFSLACSQRK